MIVIADYDPGWAALFESLRATLSAALGELVSRIEHVGSTSVPGLAAKPIVDLDAILRSGGDREEAIARLARLGYLHRGNLGIAGREAFTLRGSGPSPGAHHLYLCDPASAEWRRHLLFRDALRADAALVAAYAALKWRLANLHLQDRDAYTAAKTEFVEAVLRAAGKR